MPKKTNRLVLLSAYQLRQEGHTIDQIMDRLWEEWEEDEEVDVPDRSTVARNLKKFEAAPPDELAEDLPFTWSEMIQVPWEDSRMILDVWAFYETYSNKDYFGPFTRRLAKWSWRVTRAFDGVAASVESNGDSQPTGRDMIVVAVEYAWREIASAVLNERFDTDEIDSWLAFKPWTDFDRFRLFQVTKYPQGYLESERSPVHWRQLDLDWLEKVWPAVAAKRKRPMTNGQDADETTASKLLHEGWAKAIDGLLMSQIEHYKAVRYPNTERLDPAETSETDPWYFGYLDEIARWGEPEFWASKTGPGTGGTA